MRIARLGSIAVMGAAVVGLAAVPAFADGGIYSAEGGAYAGWSSRGDKITVCDEKKDGYAAVAKLWFKEPGESNFSRYGDQWAYGGVNTCEPSALSWIEEGSHIRIQACLGRNSRIVESTCGLVRNDLA